MRTGFKVILGVIIIAAILGVITYLNKAPKSDTELVSAVEHTRYPVQVYSVKKSTLIEKLTKTGVLEAQTDVILSAQVAGQVKKVNKKLGDECKKGEVLVQIDRENYRLGVDQAQAATNQAKIAVEQAERSLARFEKLKAAQVATEQQYEAAQNGLSAAKAALAQAKASKKVVAKSLKDTQVKCPFSGIIAERMVEVGQTVGPSVPLARIVNVDSLKLVINVSSKQLNRLKVGQNVSLVGNPGEPVTAGVIDRLGIAANRDTRSFPVHILTKNEHGLLRPGQIVTSSSELNVHTDVFTTPEQTLITEDNKTFVMVVENGKAHKRAVQVGPTIDNTVIVLKGLAVNDNVISVGVESVKENSPVEIIGGQSTSKQHKSAAQGDGQNGDAIKNTNEIPNDKLPSEDKTNNNEAIESQGSIKKTPANTSSADIANTGTPTKDSPNARQTSATRNVTRAATVSKKTPVSAKAE